MSYIGRVAEGPVPTFALAVVQEGPRTILALRGDLDIAAEEPLSEAVNAVFERAPRELTVDLRSLSFMDSTGLRSLLQLRKRCREFDCRLKLVRGRPTVDRIFALSHTDALFEIVDAPEGPNGRQFAA
jgi:anti-anti-sigma factor